MKAHWKEKHALISKLPAHAFVFINQVKALLLRFRLALGPESILAP